ncbi:TVP38/TMEM64 family protein [Polymorphum gilvum]|uniref:TVP38/TMEM64 family membrane protein n=1 Tax=Polymorphum gilvum (strain LMG 25793 / CGMCC 1.9160 / SL003B-26A1) TaxID=991905 RepID=F2J1Z1_POLGS|nr:VTT domain-containing protein [Polymorphum gilvum]ADZ72052.1 SNARE associated Golgi protein-like protein [Polymorphum gilvum SL003B-26A1]
MTRPAARDAAADRAGHPQDDTGAASSGATRRAARRRGLKRWAPLAAIAVLMAVGVLLGWHEHLTLSALIRHRELLSTYVGDRFLLALSAYGVVYALSVALSFPGAVLLTVAGGFLFGWVFGALVAAIAATAGATAIFLAARSSLGAALKARAGPFLARLAEGFRADAVSYLLFLRLTPVFPFWLVNIAPALFHVPLATFVLTTAIGILPGTFAFAFIGSGLDSVIAAQEAADPGCAAAGTCRIDVGALVTTELLVALFALGIAALIPVVLRVLRARRQSTGHRPE